MGRFAALWLQLVEAAPGASALGLVVAVAGCGTVPVPMNRANRTALAPELRSHYQYPPTALKAVTDSVKERSGYRLKDLTLISPDSPELRPIRIDWYEPNRPGRLPVVLISPILAGNDLYIREFAQFYAARGLHAVIVYRPKEVFSPDRQLKEIEAHLQESVIGLRRAIDWLQQEETVDPDRIGTFAISLGAILTTILAAVEPRVRSSVLGLPAGEVAEIIMTSKDKAIRKRRKAYLERHGITPEAALRELKEVILSEPIRFAPAIDPNRVLIIAGLFDRVLGFQRSLALWRGMGRPRLILLPTGHYTAYFATGYLKAVTYSFLKRSFKSS